jgi:hypothetical protein
VRAPLAIVTRAKQRGWRTRSRGRATAGCVTLGTRSR